MNKFEFHILFVQIMTQKARSDVHMNLQALQKLDCMLLVGGLSTHKIRSLSFTFFDYLTLMCRTDRKHLTQWFILSFGMRKWVAKEKEEAEVLARTRDGGCLLPGYLQSGSLRKKERGCFIMVNCFIKYSRLPNL